jgi:hypothetical protein
MYRAVEDFGDGTNGTTSLLGDLSSLANHTYTIPGTYYPTFTVLDAAGHSQSWSFTITVDSPISVATLLSGAGVLGALMIGVGVVSVGNRRQRDRSEAAALFQALYRGTDKSDPSLHSP